MRFTAVVAASLACASSVSAFLSPLSFFGSPYGVSPYGAYPYGGQLMSGCGNQAGLLNVGALNYNNCGYGAGGGIGSMSCSSQYGALNVAALTANSCSALGGGGFPGSFLKNDKETKADDTA